MTQQQRKPRKREKLWSVQRQEFTGNRLCDGILIRLERSDGYLVLRTYARAHGRSRSFYISVERLARWLYEDYENGFLDRDAGDYLYAHRTNEGIRMEVTWLSTFGEDLLKGYRQWFTLPEKSLREAIGSKRVHTFLYAENRKTPKLDFTHAENAVRAMLSCPLKKRAFSKAVCKSFQWPGSESITFYSDFPKGSFAFSENNGRGICGGFILHTSTTSPGSENRPRLYYSVHT